MGRSNSPPRRGRRTSGADAFFKTFARLPWWAGVLAAALSYALLHRLALSAPGAEALKPGQMGAPVAHLMAAGIAKVAQYLVPLFCLLGAAASAWAARQRRDQLQLVADAQQPSMLEGLDWRAFEQVVGEALRQRGWRVTETGGNGPDGGVDLELRRGNELHLVQCKQWRALKVGVDVVRQLYGVMAARGAAGGLVITSGRYTADAVAFAQGRHIELIDGDTLKGWIAQARRSPRPAPTAAPTRAAATSRPPRDPEAVVVPLKPNCPRCGGAMVRRTARQGANAGKGFWGCEGYPGCRGTLDVN